MFDRRLLLLLTACIGLAAVNAVELRGDAAGSTIVARPPARVAPEPVAPKPPPIAVGKLMATALDRPLFSPTRRPPSAGGGPVEEAFIGDRLTGIIVSPERRLAIFAVPAGKPIVVTEGDSVGGWQVETITPTAVSLRGPSGSRIFQPKADAALDAKRRALPAANAVPPGPPAGRPAARTARAGHHG